MHLHHDARFLRLRPTVSISLSLSLSKTFFVVPKRKIRNKLVDYVYQLIFFFRHIGRGYQVRFENECNNHPIVPILKKIRSHNLSNKSSLTIRERMMEIIQEIFLKQSPSSLNCLFTFIT